MCYLNCVNMDFSIIGLSETWGRSIHIDMQNIPGYEHYYCIMAKTRKGGSTSLYVKSSIPFKNRPDLEFKKSIFESSVIEIDKHVFYSRHNVITGIFYRSPNSALNSFNDSLEKLLINHCSKFFFACTYIYIVHKLTMIICLCISVKPSTFSALYN